MKGELLPVLLMREGRLQLYDDAVRPLAGDRVDFALSTEQADTARTWLESHGWKREAPPAAQARHA
jgi:hypothetical protein